MKPLTWQRLEYVLRTRRNLQRGDKKTREALNLRTLRDVRRKIYNLQTEEKTLWAYLRPDIYQS